MSVPEGLPKMEYRFLGRSGLQVSAISLGGWLTYGGHVDNENTFACMKAAYDVGINFFDCAESYSGGESETQIGLAIKHFGWKRNDLVISTKIYWGAGYGSNPVNNVGLSRKHIIEGVDAALQRLGLNYVDLVFAHRADRNTPIEETVRAFNYLIDAGKVMYWGTSEWSAVEIAAANAVAERLGLIGPTMEQPCYNMLERQKVDQEYSYLFEATGMGLTIWSPLKGGVLTGKYNDKIPENSRVATAIADADVKDLHDSYGNEEWETDLKIVRKLAPLAEKLGVSQTNLAYAWVLKNKHVSSAITGASRPQQIYDAVKAFDVVKLLTDEVMEEIDGILGNKPLSQVRRF